MAIHQLVSILDYVKHISTSQRVAEMTDGQLLITSEN